MGAPILFCVMYWNFLRCSRAWSTSADCWYARDSPNSAEACRGLSFRARSKASMACGNCLACAYAVPRKYQVSASLGSISVTRLKASMAASRVSSVLGQQAEAVPRVRILRVLLESVVQGRFGLIDFLKVQVGDANVQARDCQCGVGFDRGLERLQALFEKLLVHVGHAEIVEARGFDGIRSFRLSLRDAEKRPKAARSMPDESDRDSRCHSIRFNHRGHGEHRGIRSQGISD